MEKIQDHPIKDIWRVQDGLLVEINKYESLGYHLYDSKIKKKVVRGCKGLTVLTEDYTETYSKRSYPKGTLCLNGTPVKPVDNPMSFTADVKSSGGSIYGSMARINSVMNQIKEILQSYI